MIGELILTSYTIDNGRVVLNNTFSNYADFNLVTATNLTMPSISINSFSGGGTITWDYSICAVASVTLTASKTLVIENLRDGCSGILFITQGGLGFNSLTLPTNPLIHNLVVNGGGGAVTLSVAIGQTDKLSFIYRVIGLSNVQFYWSIEKNYS